MIIKCPECKSEMSSKVEARCPKCGYKKPKIGGWIALALIIIAIIVAVCCSR